MVFSTATNAVMMFAYAITMLFGIRDYEKVSASSLPIMETYFQASKSKKFATVMMVLKLPSVAFPCSSSRHLFLDLPGPLPEIKAFLIPTFFRL